MNKHLCSCFYVKNADGEYFAESPIEGAVIANVGDTLQHWTKGKLKSG